MSAFTIFSQRQLMSAPLQEPVRDSKPAPNRYYQAADIDGDRRDEIVTLDRSSGRWEIIRRAGDGELVLTPAGCASKEMAESTLGNWRGDGIARLGTMDYYGTNLRIFPLNDPSCTMTTIPMVHRAHHTLVGSGDVTGTGLDLPIFRRVDGLYFFLGVPTTDVGHDQIWADFFELSRDGPHAIGDFTGDGRTDILLFSGSPLHGWWLAVSIGWTSVELPVGGLPAAGTRGGFSIFPVSDLNDDGAKDLFVRYADCSGTLYTFEHGAPLVEINVRAETTTGESEPILPGGDGTFSTGERVARLAAEADGFSIFPRSLPVSRSAAHLHRFIAFDRGPDLQSHAPITLSGESRGPYVCFGATPGSPSGKWGRVAFECPKNYAVIEIDDSDTSRRLKEGDWISASCCRLPFDDVLEDESGYFTGNCPANTIATSAPRYDPAARDFKLRCTKINTAKYSITGDIPGTYWGTGLSMRGAAHRMARERIPGAARPAFGRVNQLRWDADGCAPPVFGSLFTGMRGPSCGGARFKTLRLAPAPDRPGEIPPEVKMFPDCGEPKDPYSPLEGCPDRRTGEE